MLAYQISLVSLLYIMVYNGDIVLSKGFHVMHNVCIIQAKLFIACS